MDAGILHQEKAQDLFQVLVPLAFQGKICQGDLLSRDHGPQLPAVLHEIALVDVLVDLGQLTVGQDLSGPLGEEVGLA